MGYRVSGLAARVVWNQPDPIGIPPRSHMVLRVELEDRHLSSPMSASACSPTAPLRLVPDVAQETPHESFRLLRSDGHFTLQCNLKGQWTSFYMFDLQEQAPVDYQVANHYVSTWPTSHFVTSLIAARATADGRYGLRNNRLSIHRMNGESEQRVLTSAAEISAVLKDLFGVVVPDQPAFAASLARLDWPDFSAS